MKKLRSFAFIGLVAGVLLSCNKNNSTSPNANSTDEAADLVTASVSTNTQSGALNSFSDVTVSSETKVNIDTLCGTVWTDSVNRSIPVTPGVPNNYSYKANYSYALNCNNGVYNHSATINSAYNGSFNNASLSSIFAGSADFTVSGLGRTYTAYVINGEYKRSGSFQSKTDTSYHGTNNVDIVFTNLTLIKPLQVIKSGSASFTISGNMPSKGAFNYTGTIVFNGNENATLTVNGTVYLINLATGTKQKK
ncbi:hypothetical protein [Mucilaginibacter sp.]